MNRLQRNEKSIADLRRRTALSITRGALSQTPQGITLSIPAGPQWVWIYGVLENGVALVKPALRRLDGTWVASAGPAMRRVYLSPNYTPEHFAAFGVGALNAPGGIYTIPFLVESNTLPTAADIACKIEGGYLVPDYRMKLVAAADVSELCEPCNPSPLLAVPGDETETMIPPEEPCGCGG